MKRSIIAVDIDDVLADSIQRFIDYIEVEHGVRIEKSVYSLEGEYLNYHERVLRAHDIDGDGIVDKFFTTFESDQSDVKVIESADTTLSHLSERYDIVAISARPKIYEPETQRWIQDNFSGVFKDVRCIDTFNSAETKGSVCNKIGAEYLVDDHISHCRSVLEYGISPVLFGEYGWNINDDQGLFVRCRNWEEVKGYFDALS